MQCRYAIFSVAIAGALITTPASAFDDAKYPDVSGQWVAVRIPGVGGQPAFDPYKPWGRGQDAPLTPEYKAIHEQSLADQAAGGQGGWLTGSNCYPPGMPGMMNLYQAMEIVVLPEITYVLIDHAHDSHRRIYTDGRDWPKEPDGTFLGYSIGRWIDEDGDGRYDVLEVETRNFKGPRTLDPSGMPTHADNQSIVNERIYFDKSNPKLLINEITLTDHAFTRPWKVKKTYTRNAGAVPELARIRLHRRQRAREGRQRDLLQERRRQAHADAPRSTAARPAIFQASAEVTRAPSLCLMPRESGASSNPRPIRD